MSLDTSLAILFANIANAIKYKKGYDQSKELHIDDYADEILSIGDVKEFEHKYKYYEYDPTSSSEDKLENLKVLFSNIADAIRAKTEIDGNLVGINFREEILKIKSKLDTPSIHIHFVGENIDPDKRVNLHMYLDNIMLCNKNLSDGIDTQLLGIRFKAVPNYNLPDSIEVTGVNNYEWNPSWSPIDHMGKLRLNGFQEDTVNINISAIQYKLLAPKIDLYSTIVFKHEDGTLLKRSHVKHGTIPLYLRKTPYKEGDATPTYYVFLGWSPDIVPVTHDAVYTAVFRGAIKNLFTITWIYRKLDGEEVKLQTLHNVPLGEIPEYTGSVPELHDREYHYNFSNWCNITYSGVDKVIPASGDDTYLAKYNSFPNVVVELNAFGGITYTIRSWDPQFSADNLVCEINDVELISEGD